MLAGDRLLCCGCFSHRSRFSSAACWQGTGFSAVAAFRTDQDSPLQHAGRGQASLLWLLSAQNKILLCSMLAGDRLLCCGCFPHRSRFSSAACWQRTGFSAVAAFHTQIKILLCSVLAGDRLLCCGCFQHRSRFSSAACWQGTGFSAVAAFLKQSAHLLVLMHSACFLADSSIGLHHNRLYTLVSRHDADLSIEGESRHLPALLEPLSPPPPLGWSDSKRQKGRGIVAPFLMTLWRNRWVEYRSVRTRNGVPSSRRMPFTSSPQSRAIYRVLLHLLFHVGELFCQVYRRERMKYFSSFSFFL
ncbi:uncharacterized protein LOC120923271 isoform X2 [Rana temporaria]|uniref:uncharacterized protein LOC120923271 isoform X2 n=1 Tax=Rana temporaria TaxID=8407 RepID=UPI001AAC73D1|nr:uncharacterized protein LOC120923271 isoform X2 [Rana temporaria]